MEGRSGGRRRRTRGGELKSGENEELHGRADGSRGARGAGVGVRVVGGEVAEDGQAGDVQKCRNDPVQEAQEKDLQNLA